MMHRADLAHRADRGVRPGGFVLLAVLVVAMMTSLIVVSLMFRVRAEESAHAAAHSGEQARAVAMSGVAQAMQIARDNAHAHTIWRDNADSFQDQLVVDDGVDRWYFSLYAPPAEEGGEIRFGLTDEASRLNLHRVDADAIASLPDLSLVLAERIKAHLGSESGSGSGSDSESDSEVNADADAADPPDAEGDSDVFDQLDALADSGAEAGASDVDTDSDSDAEAAEDFSLFDSGSPSASPPDLEGLVTLDHLLEVDGITVALLYGESEDSEDSDEQPRSISAMNLPPTNAARLRSPSLRDFATLLSREPNVDMRGNARINIADPEADLSELGFSEELIEAIEARREDDDEPLTHVLDVLMSPPPEDEADEEEGEDSEGSLSEDSGSTSTESESAMTEFAVAVEPEELRELLERCTVTDDAMIHGRVNVNTAPVEVLAALPGIDESLADSIVSAREGLEEEQSRTIAWLIEDQVLELQQFVDVAPYLTTRSYQFHVRVFAYAVPSRRYRVMEAVIDTAGETPRVVFLRDLTRLGPPLPMNDNEASSSGTLARTR